MNEELAQNMRHKAEPNDFDKIPAGERKSRKKRFEVR